MSKYIKQGNIFGRIGTGLGKGLAEQLPKEIERSRLASGLKELGEKKDLTPFQQFSRLAAIPGITPQMLQSGSELLKTQSMREALANPPGTASETFQASPDLAQRRQELQNVPFAATQGRRGAPAIRERPEEGIVRPEEVGQPQALEKNPLRPEAQPIAPFSPEQRDAELNKIYQQFPWMTPEQAQGRLEDTERRRIAQAQTERERDAYNEEQAKKINDTLTKRLELLTHKKGDELFRDITGEMQNNFRRTVEKDLKENPNLTLDDAVNKRATQLLELAKTKGKVQLLAKRDFLDKINPLKKQETFKKLLTASERYNDLGNNEEYFNFLRNPKEGFGLSPFNAAWIAYPRSKVFNQFADTIKSKKDSNHVRTAQYYADQVSKLVRPEDSVLSMYAELKQRDPYFDPNIFFDEMRRVENLTDRQKDELIMGEPDFFPNWGDIFLFPLTSGGWL